MTGAEAAAGATTPEGALASLEAALVSPPHATATLAESVKSTPSTNNPRFLRHGPIHGHFMFANACMHCADPVCMVECPTGAIFRDIIGGEVVINDRTCIGCSMCAKNCPYDAIRMVEVRERIGSLIRDEQGRLPIQQATKCDLCVEQRSGPACQNACPHDALVRVNMTELQSLGDVFNR